MKKVFRKATLLTSIIALSIILVGCLSIKGLFSDGQKNLKVANELWGKGKKLEALVAGTQAVITDSVFIQGKSFLKDRFDPTINETMQRLTKINKPSNSVEAEEKYYDYMNLVKIYDNLKQLHLPLRHPKGKWSWTTKIIDYTAQRDLAFNEAFTILMAEGRNFLKSNNVSDAENRFLNAANNYTKSVQQKDSVKNLVVKEICDKANPLSTSNSIEKVTLANSLYNSAHQIVRTYQIAIDGISKTKIHISDLYVKKGKQLENKGTVKSFVAALEQYKLAIKWNSQNTEATASKTTVIERIAEYYYQLGVKAENSNKFDQAIAMYTKTRKWISDYKDAMSRIYNIRITAKLQELITNLSVTQAEFNKVNSKLASVSSSVNKCDDLMNKITYISDHTRSLSEKMKKISTTLKVFKIIPYVGTPTSILARAVDMSQKPVGEVAQKITAIERPVITPTKAVVSKTKGIIDKVNGNMNATANALNKTKLMTEKLRDCISGMKVEKNFKNTEIALTEVNKGVVKMNKSLKHINTGITKVWGVSKKINAFESPVNKATNGIKKVDKVLRKIDPIVNELNKALDKNFTLNLLFKKYTFTVRKILTGLPGAVKAIMGKFSDLAMGVVKPIMKKFNLNIPTVPGITKIKQMFNKMEGYYNTFKNQVNTLDKSAKDFASQQLQISKNLSKIERSTGCQISAN